MDTLGIFDYPDYLPRLSEYEKNSDCAINTYRIYISYRVS